MFLPLLLKCLCSHIDRHVTQICTHMYTQGRWLRVLVGCLVLDMPWAQQSEAPGIPMILVCSLTLSVEWKHPEGPRARSILSHQGTLPFLMSCAISSLLFPLCLSFPTQKSLFGSDCTLACRLQPHLAPRLTVVGTEARQRWLARELQILPIDFTPRLGQEQGNRAWHRQPSSWGFPTDGTMPGRDGPGPSHALQAWEPVHMKLPVTRRITLGAECWHQGPTTPGDR